MSNFINFFPGNTRDARSIEVSEVSAYATASDLGDLIDSMLKGCTASIAAGGIKDALEDGALLGAISEEYGIEDEDLQELAEELHGALQEPNHRVNAEQRDEFEQFGY